MNGNELSHERFERIEAYLLGTLSPEDRTRFEAELEADEQLREEVSLQREHIRAIQLGGFTRTLEQAAQRHSENDESGRVLSLARSGRNWVPWAAAIAALVAVAIWALVRPPLNERVYAEFHVPDPGLPVPMGAAEDHAFHDAMVAYKLGDHAEALMKWEGTPAYGPGQRYAALFHRLCHPRVRKGRGSTVALHAPGIFSRTFPGQGAVDALHGGGEGRANLAPGQSRSFG
ncbi:MAG: hypothetical protein H6593_06040 [Flavobacteriales bacterium]|nr:hypothetical protein [Flavobacteriales bacterium]